MTDQARVGSLKKTALLVVPLIVIATLFAITIPIRANLVSNANLLNPVWVSGYCAAPGQATLSCPISLSNARNGLIQISATENISTVLFQLSPSYADLLSHSHVTYDISANSLTMENLTFKFSQVVNSNYYSGLIASVSTAPAFGLKSTTGSLSLDSMHGAFSETLGNAARFEVNVEPSTNQFFIGINIASEDVNSIGHLLTGGGLQLSGLAAGLGAFYGIFPRTKGARIIGVGLTGASTIIFGNTVSSEIFATWPPFDPSFTWLFSLGALTGVAILMLYFLTERSRK